MKKYIWTLIVSVFFLAGCATYVPPIDNKARLEALLNGSFKAILVKEDNQIVYLENATNNIIAGYAMYRLVFDNGNVKLTEYTGEVFNGNWNLTTSNGENFKLILTNLTPIPTNTIGEIEFEILSYNDEIIELRNLNSNPKTGNTLNYYKLRKN